MIAQPSKPSLHRLPALSPTSPEYLVRKLLFPQLDASQPVPRIFERPFGSAGKGKGEEEYKALEDE
jgi:hypothetical protein